MDCPFSLVLAGGFYDGAEEGVAIRSDGSGLAFRSLADSPSRRLRAFCFRPIVDEGAMQALVQFAAVGRDGFVLLPSDADAALSKCSDSAGVPNQIGIGDPYLKWLRFARAASTDVGMMIDGQTEPAIYRRAHDHLKAAERSNYPF